MDIGVEASVLVDPERAGIYYYTSEVLRAAAQAMPDDQFFLTYMNLRRRNALPLEIDLPNTVERRAGMISSRLYKRHLRSPTRIPFDVLTRSPADVFFFPNFVAWPTNSTDKTVAVIHDLSYLKTREHGRERFMRYLHRYVPETLGRASHVIVTSDAVRQELLEEYSCDVPISVVPAGVDRTQFRPSSTRVDAVKAKYGIDRDYVLYTGTIEPRKNLVRLLQAYGSLDRDLRDAHALVLVGRRGWMTEGVDEAISTLRTRGMRIIATGFVPRCDLGPLYSGAKVFVYPSLYEGFGMPVLEAMASGAPVVAAAIPALQEVGGDTATYVDPFDVDAIAAAVDGVVRDPEGTALRRQRGLERAAAFDWTASGQKLAHVLRSVATPS